jgi:phosphotransferase system HPr (HPr) family protein
MKEKTVVIQMKQGMHARPASVFVREAGRFASEVQLTADGVTVNGKSIMGILMLALSPGSQVTLRVDGVDEDEALKILSGVLSGHAE